MKPWHTYKVYCDKGELQFTWLCIEYEETAFIKVKIMFIYDHRFVADAVSFHYGDINVWSLDRFNFTFKEIQSDPYDIQFAKMVLL
jgi:hypothetical protein